jgi:hypothetical protein
MTRPATRLWPMRPAQRSVRSERGLTPTRRAASISVYIGSISIHGRALWLGAAPGREHASTVQSDVAPKPSDYTRLKFTPVSR